MCGILNRVCYGLKEIEKYRICEFERKEEGTVVRVM